MSNTPHQSLDELSDEEERDELSSWLLRTHTAGEKLPWSSLTANNWKHHTTHGHEYEEPPFSSKRSRTKENNEDDDVPLRLPSNELQEYLDQFALPSVLFSSLEAPPVTTTRIQPPHRKRRHEALRNDLLTRLFFDRKPGKKIKRTKAQEAPKKTGDTETTTNKAKAKNAYDGEERKTKKMSSRPTRAKASSTIFEPGADMYMKKRQIRNSYAQRKSDDNDDEREKLPMPLPSECVQELFNNSNKNNNNNESDPPLVVSHRQMEKFAFLLSTNHSLLFLGFGSKRHVLNSFAKRLEYDGDVLNIQGYHKNVTVNAILDILVGRFLDGKEPNTSCCGSKPSLRREQKANGTTELSSRFPNHSLVKRAVAISRELAATRKRPIFLVLHNIDGVGLRQNVSQQALSALVLSSTVSATGTRAVRLVSSVDHVNAVGLLWDVTTRANFSWIWHEIHTFQSYHEEVKDGFDDSDFKNARALSSSFASRKRARVSFDKLQQLLTSLAPRISESLQLLASLQLEASAKGDEAVDYVAWRQECTKRMVTSSDSVLRQFLEELTDHEIVERNVDPHAGTERVSIPCSQENLHDIMNFEIARKK